MTSSILKVICCLFAVCLVVQAQNPEKKLRSGSISGKVTLKGSGVAGIIVGAREMQSGRRRASVVVTTDQQGNYRMSNVAPGQYEVVPAAPQFVLAGQDAIKTLLVGEGETFENIDFKLVRGGVITGKVTDADGRPVIEESIEIFAIGGTGAEQLVLMNILADPTDDRGVYRIYGLRPGKYRVAAGTSEERMYYGSGRRAVYRQTYHPSTTEESEATIVEVTEGGEAANVDITLRRTLNVYTVTARVVDADTGQPIPDATYGLQRFRENGSSSSSGPRSNKLGEIKIENVTPGKYALFLEPSAARDLYAEPVLFEVVDQDVKDLVIRASSGGSVSGVVVFEGVDEKTLRNQFAPLMVFARSMSNDGNRVGSGGSTPHGPVGSDGSFTVGGLRPGVLNFFIWGRRAGPTNQFEVTQIERDGVFQPGVEIKGREHIKGLRLIVKSRTGRIRGVVKFENGQVSASRVYISVKKVGEENLGTSAKLDDRGRFMTEVLAAGVYEVSVFAYPAQGPSSTTKQQVVVTDNQVSEITLTLDLKAGTRP